MATKCLIRDHCCYLLSFWHIIATAFKWNVWTMILLRLSAILSYVSCNYNTQCCYFELYSNHVPIYFVIPFPRYHQTSSPMSAGQLAGRSRSEQSTKACIEHTKNYETYCTFKLSTMTESGNNLHAVTYSCCSRLM